jgi:hypothetical protein
VPGAGAVKKGWNSLTGRFGRNRNNQNNRPAVTPTTFEAPSPARPSAPPNTPANPAPAHYSPPSFQPGRRAKSDDFSWRSDDDVSSLTLPGPMPPPKD